MRSEESRVAPGTLLLSVPQMLDPNFMHTVVLICDHTAQGAYGLVLNKKLGVRVEELLEDHPVLGDVPLDVHEGGPVGRDTLQFLHRVPDDIEGGMEVTEGLYLGGELEQVAGFGKRDAASGSLRVFLGYSGWGAGQLDGELAVGSWVLAPYRAELLFECDDQQTTWRRAMRGLGRDGESLSHQPPDPSWN